MQVLDKDGKEVFGFALAARRVSEVKKVDVFEAFKRRNENNIGERAKAEIVRIFGLEAYDREVADLIEKDEFFSTMPNPVRIMYVALLHALASGMDVKVDKVYYDEDEAERAAAKQELENAAVRALRRAPTPMSIN